MSHFAILAHGADVDADALRASSTLRIDGVWHAGDRHHVTSGVRVVLGDGFALPWHEQERVAFDYLTANADAVRAVATWPGVTTAILGLQYHLALTEGLVGFALSFAEPLLRQALDVRLGPTCYVTFKEPVGHSGAARRSPPRRAT